MDKNQAVINFLIQCPRIRDNPLFFNFAEVEDNSRQIVTMANDRVVNKPYIDGSVLKRFTFTLVDYRTVTYQSIVKLEGYPNENVSELMDIQSVMDWINEQADLHNYPDFGSDCVIESMRTATDEPTLNGVDKSVSPSIAQYSMSIIIEYIDNSKKNWN